MLGYLSKSHGRHFAGGLRPIPWPRITVARLAVTGEILDMRDAA
jgi:hypothetical protein